MLLEKMTMIRFNGLTFDVKDGRCVLVTDCGEYGFSEVQIAGENKDSHFGNKMICSSEGRKLKYLSHEIGENRLEILQASDSVKVKTVFTGYTGTNAVSVYTETENISDREIVLEEVSAFVHTGFCGNAAETDKTYFTRFVSGHHCECQPIKSSLRALGLTPCEVTSQKRIFGLNVGSWSTKEELPQGILEWNGRYTMFQIESSHGWYYEISDDGKRLYLYLGGVNTPFGGWCKRLTVGESYRTITVALSFGNTLNGVIGAMTVYRRHIKGVCPADEELPTVFNEYMHLSWDNPSEENTKKYLSVVSGLGINYYVIDCGWHNEEPSDEIYSYVGQWKESKVRFPHGIRETTDSIRRAGMKAGLWIEPEVVGYLCKEMLDYYDEECFIRRNGKKVLVMGRYFLDFRHPKVIAYLTETVRRMVEDYGADYIKMDYNQDLGAGCDRDADSLASGLEAHLQAFLNWIDEIRKMYPNVLFETCASGGLRMDYNTLRHFSIVSTSDQTDYRKYPYIAGNIFSAVLPEQAAVWSYPAVFYRKQDEAPSYDGDCLRKFVSDDQIAMNMINALLGRIHLASHLEFLSKSQLSLIKEGLCYYERLRDVKQTGMPVYPLGFNDFSRKNAVCGLFCENTLYLAVWNLGNTEKKLSIPLEGQAKKAKISYPKNSEIKYIIQKDKLEIIFAKDYQAGFFEIEINL